MDNPEKNEKTEKKPKEALFTLKNLVFASLLAALVVFLQIVGGIPAGPFNITLTLVPIVVGAILLGWQYGTVLGLIFGLVVSILSVTGRDPGGRMVFQTNPVMGWTLCLLKGAAAGFFPAIVYRAFSKFQYAKHVLVALSGAFLFVSGFAVSKLVSPEKAWQTALLVIFAALLSAGYMLLIYRAFQSGKAAVYLAAMVSPIANTGIFVLGMALFYRELLATWANGTNVALFVIGGLVGVNFIIEFSVAVLLSPAVARIVETLKKQKSKES